jgi:hypothetical protein
LKAKQKITNTNTGSTIALLTDESVKMGEIVSIIHGIADQTNSLAFNTAFGVDIEQEVEGAKRKENFRLL